MRDTWVLAGNQSDLSVLPKSQVCGTVEANT